ncbi:MAG: tetratricopeptide repeat protein [Candidatus Azobacteroides sp.]|nr:tetratricopeptide repeat protein [Candidatus Azobacteroides sp.]
MRKYIVCLIGMVIAISAPAQKEIEQANEAYTQGDFNKAVELYQQAIEKNGISAGIYYNMGNSYYRLNQIAPAILYYERSLLLSPGNKDTRSNLEIARLNAVDKIEPVGEFFLAEGYNAVKNLYSTDQWSYMAIGCFLLALIGLSFFFFSRKILLKKMGFYAALVFLVFCLLANTFAFNQKKMLTHRNTAIIFSPTTTLKSSPDNSGTDLFILHEGTKVEVKNKLGEWNEIETADGNVGWIKSNEIEII